MLKAHTAVMNGTLASVHAATQPTMHPQVCDGLNGVAVIKSEITEVPQALRVTLSQSE